MNTRHLWAIARKEFIHILRDRGTFLLVTVGPIFLMITFTYALTSDVKNLSIAVVDHAQNEQSREFIRRLDDAEVMNVTEYLNDESEADALFENNKVVAAVIIPADYGTISAAGTMPTIQAIIDGTEPISAGQVLDSVYQIADAYTREVASEQLAGTGFDTAMLEPPINVQEDTLFNPDLRTVVDFYPGLAGMMLTLPAIALAMSLARENEMGTLEQLVASPIDKRALLLGKLLPYLVFGMIDVYVLLLLGYFVYDVPFEGNLPIYSLVAFLYMFANLGLGLLIAVLIRSQQVAMIVAVLVFFVPPFFLSGLFFPTDIMPWIVQLELIELPATHFVAAARSIQLQGASLRTLWFPVTILVILAAEVFEIAAFIFRKKVILTFSLRNLFHRNVKSGLSRGATS